MKNGVGVKIITPIFTPTPFFVGAGHARDVLLSTEAQEIAGMARSHSMARLYGPPPFVKTRVDGIRVVTARLYSAL